MSYKEIIIPACMGITCMLMTWTFLSDRKFYKRFKQVLQENIDLITALWMVEALLMAENINHPALKYIYEVDKKLKANRDKNISTKKGGSIEK